MAHPIRPRRYIEINNFYTAHRLPEGRRGHPHAPDPDRRRRLPARAWTSTSSATTARRSPARTSSAAMADASGRDLAQFMRWYEQAGTPRDQGQPQLRPGAAGADAGDQPEHAATPGQPEKLPFHIPIRLGLARAGRRAAAAAARRRKRTQGHRPRARAHRGDPELHLPGPARSRSRRCCAASRPR